VRVKRISRAELARETAHKVVAASPQDIEANFRDLLWEPSMAAAFDRSIAERPEPTINPEPVRRSFPESEQPVLTRSGPPMTPIDYILRGDLAGVRTDLPDRVAFSGRRGVGHLSTGLSDTTTQKEMASALELPAAVLQPVAPGLGKADAPPAPTVSKPLPAIGYEIAIGTLPEPRTDGLEQVRPTEVKPTIDKPSGAEEIDLAVNFETYQEPGQDDRFFRLSIGPAPNTRLTPLAQDHLFVCDISLSITLEELTETRAALERILAGLPKGHRFNVVVFSDRMFSLHRDFVEPTPERIAAASKFVVRRSEHLLTDLCSAMRTVAGQIKQTSRPVALYLVSDGASTRGIVSAKRIVTEVSSAAGGNTSIFTFNAGPDANEYVLQLLSYINRGEKVSVPQETGSAQQFEALVKRYSEPLLTQVQAAYGNLRVEDVHPADIPNLYQGRPIVLWGRCQASGSVAIRIVGNSATGRKTFFANFEIDPQKPGRPEIAREWARGRINYLVSLMARQGTRREWTAEIERLGQHYQVHTPYD
jgi:hypothetical protein